MNEIAVIIPLYNGSAWIGQTLEAVLRQSVAATEIVVVDDGSTDGGPEIARKYGGVRLLENPDKGANQARVFGLASTSSPYVALLDQDDRYAARHLEILSAIMSAEPQCPAVVGNYTTFKLGTEPVFADWPGEVVCDDPWEHFPYLTVASPSGVLYRRSELERIGGWPTHLEGVADMWTYFAISARHPLLQTTACTWSRGEHQQSYSAKLRGPGFMVQYMDRILHAAREVMAIRLTCRPDQAEMLNQCLGRFQLIRTVLSRLDANDARPLTQALIDFDSAFASQPDRECWLACSGLAWMVSLAGNRPGDGRLVASYLMRQWPGCASQTGAIVLDRLEAMMGRSLAGAYYLGAPTRAGRIRRVARPFVRSARAKAKTVFRRLF